MQGMLYIRCSVLSTENEIEIISNEIFGKGEKIISRKKGKKLVKKKNDALISIFSIPIPSSPIEVIP